jgi:transcription antitermination factor NusG
MQYHGEEVEVIQTPIQKGTKVLVTGGNFAGIVGEVIKINGEKKVVLSLNNSFFVSVAIDVKYLKIL